MLKLRGEYTVSVDNKGRFLVPAAFRKQLPEGMEKNFVIKWGFENEKCLLLYPETAWNDISDEIYELNDFDEETREFKRLFLAGATDVEIDGAGKINMPNHMLEATGIKKDMIMICQGTKVELWDKDTYSAYISSRNNSGRLNQLAQKIMGNRNKPTQG